MWGLVSFRWLVGCELAVWLWVQRLGVMCSVYVGAGGSGEVLAWVGLGLGGLLVGGSGLAVQGEAVDA